MLKRRRGRGSSDGDVVKASSPKSMKVEVARKCGSNLKGKGGYSNRRVIAEPAEVDGSGNLEKWIRAGAGSAKRSYNVTCDC